jgi:hypothetical protein
LGTLWDRAPRRLLACSFWVPLGIFRLVKNSTKQESKTLIFALLIFAWNFFGAFVELFFSFGESYDLYFLITIFSSSIGAACLLKIIYAEVKTYNLKNQKLSENENLILTQAG